MLALVMLYATDADDLIAVSVTTKTLRIPQRRVKHLTVDAVELAQTVGNRLRIGKNVTGFDQRSIVGCENRITDSAACDAVRYGTVFAVPQVVIEAKMVNKPKYLAWVPQHVRGRSECDQAVTGFGQVDQAIGDHLREHVARIFNERQIDPLYLMTMFEQFTFQPFDDEASAPINKWHEG